MHSTLFLRCMFVLALVLGWPTAGPAQARVAPTPHPAFEVTVTGHGRPIMLIPGLTCPGAVWTETVARYQGQYQCHVVSLAGFGGVGPPPPVPAHLLQAVRDQLLAYIKAQHLRQPLVIGHSLGGFLALWMAATDPSALGPLEIVDSLPFISAIQNPATTAETARPMAEQLRQQMGRGRQPLAASRRAAAALVTDSARITQVAR